jgi:hypothetical protein
MRCEKAAQKSIHSRRKKSVFSAILAFDLVGGRSYNPRPRRFATSVAKAVFR